LNARKRARGAPRAAAGGTSRCGRKRGDRCVLPGLPHSRCTSITFRRSVVLGHHSPSVPYRCWQRSSHPGTSTCPTIRPRVLPNSTPPLVRAQRRATSGVVAEPRHSPRRSFPLLFAESLRRIWCNQRPYPRGRRAAIPQRIFLRALSRFAGVRPNRPERRRCVINARIVAAWASLLSRPPTDSVQRASSRDEPTDPDGLPGALERVLPDRPRSSRRCLVRRFANRESGACAPDRLMPMAPMPVDSDIDRSERSPHRQP
jgi:hypothetical protein